MERGLVVHHRAGTVSIEESEVVIRLAGTRGRGWLRGPAEDWTREFRVPIAQASAQVNGPDLTILRNGRAIQTVLGCDEDQAAAFLEALDEARLPSQTPTPPGLADCKHCGAPAQPLGQPCGYCGSTERFA